MGAGVGTVEIPQQDLANQNLEEVLQQTIDVERFEAVPEHDGNLQRLIERYGDNPGSCPYIKSMGEAGVQLVQKLAEAEKNPDRGLTIRELMEARKKEAQSQAIVTEKPIPTKGAETTAATRTDIKVDRKPVEPIKLDKTTEHALAQEHAARIMSEAVEVLTRPNAKLSAETEQPKVKPFAESLTSAIVAETENVLRQQAFDDIDTQRVAEIGQSPNQTLPVTETVAVIKAPKIKEVDKRPVKIEGIAHPEKLINPVVDLASEELEAEIVDIVTTFEGTNPADANLETTIAEDAPFDIDEIKDELGLAYSILEEPDLLLAEVAADEAVIEKAELDIVRDDFDLTPVSIDVPMQAGDLGAELPVVEAAELGAYIDSLEPDKAAIAEAALESLIEALQVNRTDIDKDAENPATALKQIEHLFVELLNALSLSYEDETVKKLMKELFTPELLAEITEDYELSIDQLNYLGTREYKLTTITSMFTSLVQMIKQKIDKHLRLGKYALSASII